MGTIRYQESQVRGIVEYTVLSILRGESMNSSIWQAVQGVLIDLDGVLYVEDTVTPGAVEAIRFLREKYGQENFRRFFRNLRDGKAVGEALQSAYPTFFGSLQDLEKQWEIYMKN